MEDIINKEAEQQTQPTEKKPFFLKRLKMKYFIKGDAFIWLSVLILMLLSLLFIFSATASLVYKHHPDDPSFFVRNRFIHLFAGFVAMLIVSRIDCKRYFKWANIMFWGSVILLALTFVIGKNVNNATRAIGFIQPSDFAKIGMIIMLAKLLTKYKDILPDITFLPVNTWFSMLKQRMGLVKLTPKAQRKQDKKNQKVMNGLKYGWIFLTPIIIVCALILPSNLSTALIVGVMGMAVLVIGGVRKREIFKLAFLTGGLGYIGLFTVAKMGIFDRGATWLSRLNNFFSGEDAFQLHHAKIAIAQGWIPQGPGNSVQRASLPRAESDFMFAFIIEEYSWLVVIPIILIYIWIFQRAVVIARKHNNRFEAILATGLAFFICFQAFMHMCINIGFTPVTGLVLPFLSNGGSAVVSMGIAVAIILNVSRHQRKFEMQELKEKEEKEAMEREAAAADETIEEEETYEEEIDEEDIEEGEFEENEEEESEETEEEIEELEAQKNTI